MFLKVNIIKSFRNVSNFIPTLIVYGTDAEAFELLKKSNVAVAFIDRVFGSAYVELLDDLINVITNATATILKNSKKIDKIFELSLIWMEGIIILLEICLN